MSKHLLLADLRTDNANAAADVLRRWPRRRCVTDASVTHDDPEGRYVWTALVLEEFGNVSPQAQLAAWQQMANRLAR